MRSGHMAAHVFQWRFFIIWHLFRQKIYNPGWINSRIDTQRKQETQYKWKFDTRTWTWLEIKSTCAIESALPLRWTRLPLLLLLTTNCSTKPPETHIARQPSPPSQTSLHAPKKFGFPLNPSLRPSPTQLFERLMVVDREGQSMNWIRFKIG